MSYHGCCFEFTESEDHVCSGTYELSQFERCIKCKNFDTFYEKYLCTAEGGQECLLQIGTSKYAPKLTSVSSPTTPPNEH